MTPEIITALIDRYGPTIMIQIVGVLLLARMVLSGLRFFNRLTDTNAQRATTQNGLDESQMKLTLTMANQADAAHVRLARLQDCMIEEQRQNRETMSRLADQFTGASLLIEKNLQTGQALVIRVTDLVTRVIDWDERLAKYMKGQEKQSEVILEIGKTLTTLLTLLIPKETST